MHWPLDVPDAFADLKPLPTWNEVFSQLVSQPDEKIVSFFEWATADEIWSGHNLALMAALIKWFSIEFKARRISKSHSKRIVKAIYAHLPTLKNNLYLDISFQADEERILASSLLLGTASERFLNFIHQNWSPKNEMMGIKLPGVSLLTLKLLNEYVLTERIQNLTQYKQDEIFALLDQAEKWGFPILAALCARTLKLYLNQENVVKILLMSMRYGLSELVEACIDVVEKGKSGAHLSLKNNVLALEITAIVEETKPFYEEISPYIAYLICRKKIPLRPELVNIIRRCTHLRGIDFSESYGCDPGVIESLSNLKELELADCPWLTNDILHSLVLTCPGVTTLNLSHNPSLEFTALYEVSKWMDLISLDLSRCYGVNDQCFINIARLTKLKTVSLADNDSISDAGINAFVPYGRNIIYLDFSECPKVSPAGWIQMASTASNLQTLILRRCAGVNDDSALQIVKLCPSLRELDITECPISDMSVVENIRRQYPYVSITF